MRVVIMAVAAAALVAGCGKKNEQKVDLGNGQTATVSGGNVLVQGANGAAVTSGQNLQVSGLPDFAAIYPGGAVQTAITGGDASTQGQMISYLSREPADKIIAFYQAKAKAAGLGEASNATTAAMQMFTAADQATKRNLSVIVTPQDEQSMVTLNYTVPKA